MRLFSPVHHTLEEARTIYREYLRQAEAMVFESYAKAVALAEDPAAVSQYKEAAARLERLERQAEADLARFAKEMACSQPPVSE